MNNPQEFRLHIGGMTCAHCGQHVVSALEDIPGVERAEVPNWRSAQATVVADERVVPDMLLAAITAAGYTATVQK
ncbi:MAG: cation transporter [Aggregatilineales bacterium]